jgi:hypothetical protein
MKKTGLASVLLFTLISLVAVSCSQTEIGQLQGQWQLFYINHLDDPNIYIWDFAADGEFIVRSYPMPTDANPNPPIGIPGRWQVCDLSRVFGRCGGDI